MEAGYVLKDHIETVISDSWGETCKLYPGKYSAPEGTVLKFGTYTIVPNLDFAQPYISVDAMHINLHHPSFDTLAVSCRAVLKDLNRENPWDNTILMAAGEVEDIRYHDVVARIGRLDPNDFIEGTDFFTATIDILYQYGEL